MHKTCPYIFSMTIQSLRDHALYYVDKIYNTYKEYE